MPPVPDMSMPFNVTSLTCTVYAFIIGTLMNVLVRKSSQSVRDAYEGKRERTGVEKLKDRLREKFGWLGAPPTLLVGLLRRRLRGGDQARGGTDPAEIKSSPDEKAGERIPEGGSRESLGKERGDRD